MNNSLIQKYNIAGPRYTSYPTVPFWDKEGIAYEDWVNSTKKAFIESNSSEGISIYIHLPFCESLCTFCGCHKRITKQHSVEEPYIDTVLKEWDLYCDLFDEKPRIKEIHIGGGTPTFFSPENLKQLMDGILAKGETCDEYEFSFEAHPNNTTKEHLQTFYDLGFRRNSFGVQDYDPKVQKTINRVQSYETVKEVTVDMAGSMNLIAKKCFPKTEIVTDRFHVQKLAFEAVHEESIRLRWEIIAQENSKIEKSREFGEIYMPELLSNGDTERQLLARSRY